MMKLVPAAEAFTPPAPSTPKDHMRRDRDRFYVALRAVGTELKQLNLLSRDPTSWQPDPDFPLSTAWTELLAAENKMIGAQQARTDRLERAARWALTCDELPEDLREELSRLLTGKAARRPVGRLSDVEQVMLTQYRALDPGGRTVIRGLISRLAAGIEVAS